ncbi:MAG: hypothetical protein ACJAQ0_000864, partial [Dasania sp.]
MSNNYIKPGNYKLNFTHIPHLSISQIGYVKWQRNNNNDIPKSSYYDAEKDREKFISDYYLHKRGNSGYIQRIIEYIKENHGITLDPYNNQDFYKTDEFKN